VPPGGGETGVAAAVNQQHRGAFPASADPEAHLTNVDEVESKAFKHLAILTCSSDFDLTWNLG
jgi:hypothetical protein